MLSASPLGVLQSSTIPSARSGSALPLSPVAVDSLGPTLATSSPLLSAPVQLSGIQSPVFQPSESPVMLPTPFTQAQMLSPQALSGGATATAMANIPVASALSAARSPVPLGSSVASLQTSTQPLSPQLLSTFTRPPSGESRLPSPNLSPVAVDSMAPTFTQSALASLPLSLPTVTSAVAVNSLAPRSALSLPSQLPSAIATPQVSPMSSPLPSSSISAMALPGSSMQMAAPGSPRSPRLSPEEQALVDQYRAEMGDEEQLLTFFKRYANHSRYTSKCALDGRYFWKVLAPYDGLVEAELFVRINQGGMVDDDEEGTVRDFESGVWFDVDELAATKDAKVRYRLIKVIIDIADDAASNTGSVHSNLLIIDTKNKEIVRFEPMYDENYTEPINTMLKERFEDLLPEYSYRMLDEHPQLPTTESCPSKGMCAAYVLKKAMMVITGNDRPLNGDPKEEEEKILKFGDAIETEYGLLPDAEIMESGFSVGFSTGPTYIPPVVSPYVSPYAPYPPYASPYAPYPAPVVAPTLALGFGGFRGFGPQYYGYSWGPRFARRPGWGWGIRRHRHFGSWQHEYGTDGSTTRQKLNQAYERARENAKGGWRKVKDTFKSKEAKAADKRRDSVKEGLANAQWKDIDAQKTEEAKLAEVGDKAKKLLGVRQENGPSWNRREYGCGCSGCHRAPPRGEFGYWNHGENGRSWKSVPYIGAPNGMRSENGQTGSEGRYMGGGGEMGTCGRSEYGCGCGRSIKTPASALTVQGPMPTLQSTQPSQNMGSGVRSEEGWNPRSWTPSQQALGGAAVGGIAGGLLSGNLGGAAVGAAAGGAGGYLLGRWDRSRQRPQYGRYHGEGYREDDEYGHYAHHGHGQNASAEYGLDPRTWTPGQQALGGAVVGGLIGGPLLGMGWKGALLGAAAGGAGGYILGNVERGRRQRYRYGPPPGYYQQYGYQPGHSQPYY